MKPKAISVFLLMAAVSVFAQKGTPSARTFNGEISDSQCALRVHSTDSSHAAMLKTNKAGTDDASCTRYCVRYMGSDYVLATKSKVYHLADDSKVQEFAGEKVSVRGLLDTKTNIITIIEIKPAKQTDSK